MDKIGLKHQYSHIKAAFAPATMICGAIGVSRDVFNVHQDMRASRQQQQQESTPAQTPQQPQQQLASAQNNYSTDGFVNHSPSALRSSARPTASSPPGPSLSFCSLLTNKKTGPECGRPRPRPTTHHQKPRGHRRVPSEPIEIGDIDRVARELEHSNAIQKQEQRKFVLFVSLNHTEL